MMAKRTAKGKNAEKESRLPMEELLEQALVKEEDKPYEVSGNWVWTRLGEITTIIGGGTPSTNVDEYYTDGDIAWITPADLSGYNDVYISCGKRNITKLGLEKSSARLMPKNTVLMSSRAPIGYVAIALNDICTNQGFKSFLPSPIYKPEYLYYYLIQSKGLLESYASGTTFLELSGKNVSRISIPIPPLPEQQRIADLIESLFEKLDRAKELAQNALDSFKNRKSAILHKAFAGELTAKWREDNNVDIKRDWVERCFGDCVSSMQNGISKRSSNAGVATVVLRLANILENRIIEDDLRYIKLDNKEAEKYLLKKDDILIIRVNGSLDNVGKFIMVENDNMWAFCDHIIRARVDDRIIIPKYLMYYSQTSSYKNFVQNNIVSSAGQNTISQKSLTELKITIPPLSEQQEIVRILDNLLENEQKANELCNVIDKVDLMKKSILARAFRGELNTNNPDEESALELLKEVLKERVQG